MQAWGMSELGPGTYLGPEDHRRAFAGDHPQRLRSCGRSALLSTVAVVDEDGTPLPQDGKSVGEICHRGPGNMLGYWNMPDETAELLRGGWVHSGDIGTWDEDGYVFIVDRKKELIINSAGKNISPANLEALAKSSPIIGQAVRGGRYWRELYVGAPAGDGEGGPVIEGFVDLLVESDEGLIVVDYKTDAVGGDDEVDRAVERYRLQGATYALALERALGRPVVRCVFLFLRAPAVAVEREVPHLRAAMDEVDGLVRAASPALPAPV